MRLLLASAVSLALVAADAGAQPTRALPSDSGSTALFTRARRLVSDGNGTLGRILVDSALTLATPGTPGYAEALYWRATLAERSSDAERDFRQIAVEYAQSPRAADALVRLAQLDLVRGQPAQAREHLTRLLRDHPDAPSRARGQYWLARAALDANDPRGACSALNEAAGAAEAGSDIARQVVALRGRVAGCRLTVAIGSPRRDSGLGTRDSGAVTAESRVPSPESRVPTRGFSVQIAAYEERGGAEGLAARLVKRGLEARVVSPAPDRPPFRVRVGRYATRAEAVAAARDLKAKGLGGFVAQETTP